MKRVTSVVSKRNRITTRQLCIFIPVLNEEDNLDDLFKDLMSLKRELVKKKTELVLLIIDNNSEDNSWRKIVSNLADFRGSTAVQLVTNIGYQQSLTMSFSLIDSDAMVVYQSDRQDPIDVILQMCDLWSQGANCVVGVATNRADNFSEKLGRRVFIKLFKSSSDIANFNWFTDFYLLDRSLYKQLKSLPLQNQFIRGRIMEHFNVQHYISYTRRKREKGKSKFNFARKYQLALDAILLHATRMIRRLTLISATFSALLVCIFSLLIFLQLFSNTHSFIKSPVSTNFILLLTCLIIFLVSLVLEYLRRLYVFFQSRKVEGSLQYRGLAKAISGTVSKEVSELLRP